MSKFIGISLGNNTSCAVIDNEKGIELAISEERLNGEKNTKKFPVNALKMCVSHLLKINKNVKELNIGISSYEIINDRTMKYIDDKYDMRQNYNNFESFLKAYIKVICDLKEEMDIKLNRVDHHKAHMLPAIMMSGFLQEDKDLIAVTCDGFGDGVSGMITNCKTNEVIASEGIETSLGLIYQYVTGALGFKEHQHEGKITGLAAYGTPAYKEWFKDDVIGYDHEMHCFIPNYLINNDIMTNDFSKTEMNKNIKGFKNMLRLKNTIYEIVSFLKYDRWAEDKDIAASVQEYVEEMLGRWVKDTLQENEIDCKCNIVLSGGLFANVKINYAIKNVTNASNLFVLPPMGDEGTSIGTAINYCILNEGHKSINYEKFSQDDLYLGKTSSYKNETKINVDHNRHNVYHLNSNKDYKEIVNKLSYLLSNKNIVCTSMGGYEFGPRALGNNSILFDASNKETNDYLNARLERTEFMPFAPVTIDKFKDDLFLNTNGLDKTLKYMTISVPVTDEFIDSYKAAYHIDYTARPQVLSYNDNKMLYDIIKKYHSLTGKKVLINTSFNLHNSPIVVDHVKAYNSFKKADLDALLLDDKLIVKRGVL